MKPLISFDDIGQLMRDQNRKPLNNCEACEGKREIEEIEGRWVECPLCKTDPEMSEND